MKTISDELQDFFEATGLPQIVLARASGVPASTICNLLKRKRKGVHGESQDAIRRAMRDLSSV